MSKDKIIARKCISQNEWLCKTKSMKRQQFGKHGNNSGIAPSTLSITKTNYFENLNPIELILITTD